MKKKTETWFSMAQSDLDFARDIVQKGERHFYAVQFCHQAIEKILKAIIQEKTEEIPKHTHNFKTLCQQADLEVPEHIQQFLARLAPHYIASRYPEDMKNLAKQYHHDYVRALLKETEEVFSWFKQKLS
ncbi:MAG: hypothetical protein A3I05_06675 [Deltaproteobacteria bacterium RIFCSPLOWO2_02_FULL_44_10]|nr:MAG: hypothetical protein A3C46_06875 [Deltaproteobacteria bacterium RIFCSPHIGHO2_02_FULL_44_16]OGQ46715.1 MAG: hypothetical protein A3I05_06675 [Deltaproteobacteria bacterium RIFCSPLOWO2_02_FULL_44_10]